MFTLIFSLVAALLAAISLNKYRYIAITVALEFAMHSISYKYFFHSIRQDNPWFIFLVYCVIQLCSMLALKRLKAHFFIVFLIFINMCYNIALVASFFNHNFVMFFYAKNGFIGSIMILEIIYLGLLTKYVAYHRTKHGNSGFIDIDLMFRHRAGYINRGVL